MARTFASQGDLKEKATHFDRLAEGDYAYTAESYTNAGVVVGDDKVLVTDALATKPKLLLLDDPAAALNETKSRGVDTLIGKVAAKGITIVLVEHDMKLVMGVSDHILVFDYGRKLDTGSAKKIRANPEVSVVYLGYAATIKRS